jgi:glycosyltransferase involved in cell wall biosynthesis
MAIGLVRTAGWEYHGRFHYGKIVLESLIAARNALPAELIYLSTPRDALKALARLDIMSIGGIPLRAVEEEKHAQRPPEFYTASPPASSNQIDATVPEPNPVLKRRIEELGVKWLFLLEPTFWGIEAGMPFIMPIHDLEHRRLPHFAEVTQGGGFLYRERLFRNTCRLATLILVDSEIGKEDVIRGYGDVIDAERVKILPFGSAFKSLAGQAGRASLTQVRERYALPDRYIFYPGQFQPHKNQAAVLCALDLIRRQYGIEVEFVFCGTYNNYHAAINFKTLMEMASALGIERQVHYLGYVPDEDMPGLYEGAVALAMPTYFGPTNLPVIEAWDLGCPVITSRTRGLTELTGDAGLLASPDDPKELGDAIHSLWTSEGLRQELIRRGRDRLKTHGGNDFHTRLVEIVIEADERVLRGDRRV